MEIAFILGGNSRFGRRAERLRVESCLDCDRQVEFWKPSARVKPASLSLPDLMSVLDSLPLLPGNTRALHKHAHLTEFRPKDKERK